MMRVAMTTSHIPSPLVMTVAYSGRTDDGHTSLLGFLIHFLGEVFWDALGNDGDDTELKDTTLTPP